MWYRIVKILDWFGDVYKRRTIISRFNSTAKRSFLDGESPTLLEARICKGDSSFKHSFSKYIGSGIAIKALTGEALPKRHQMNIAEVILSDKARIRKWVSLGWDTLYIHDDIGKTGVKYPLYKYADIGGYLYTDHDEV